MFYVFSETLASFRNGLIQGGFWTARKHIEYIITTAYGLYENIVHAEWLVLAPNHKTGLVLENGPKNTTA